MRRGHDQAFEAFVPVPTSAEAFGLATALAQGRSDGPRLLLLCGPPGVGKTHLLRAIVDGVRRRCPTASIVEMTAVEVVQGMLAREENDASTVLPVPDSDWLVVDDIHVLSGKPRTQTEVGHMLSAVVKRGGRVACASGGPVSRIQILAEAVQKLTGAHVVEVAPAKPHEMRRILAVHAAAVGLRPSRHTLAVLADHARGDVRAGMGALSRLRFRESLGVNAALR